MPGDDALHNGKARAIAGEVGAMQPVEDAEQLASELHVEADAVVANVIDCLALLGQRAYLDLGVGLGSSEFHGVVE